MIIRADSGSTKTHWILIQERGKSKSFYSQGINPYFLNIDEMTRIVKECFSNLSTKEVKEVFFYGAGCSLQEKCSQVQVSLTKVFSKAKIETNSDLLAAAHALFGHQAGVACILGTGSNAAVYNGVSFTNKIQSLGYLLGDEGSGSYIGRQLVQSYFRKDMPQNLRSEFAKDYSVDSKEVLDSIYKQAFPNRYLASFAPFASKHTEDKFIISIVRLSFHDFVKYQLDTLGFNKELPIGFVGSIAFYFQDILKEELELKGYILGRVLKNPIDNLEAFYKG